VRACPPVLLERVVILRKPVAGVSRLALARFTGRTRRLLGLGEVQVLVTTNKEMQDLNRRYRGKAKTTDVLSFPAAPLPQLRRRRGNGGAPHAGDIAISAPIAAHNARCYGHSAAQEMKLLILHGLLHLAGYDHEADRGAMARAEARLRRALRLPRSLTARAGGSRS
jgi:probable rRNA maturation factor